MSQNILVDSIETYEAIIGRRLTEGERNIFTTAYNYGRMDAFSEVKEAQAEHE